MPTSTTPQPDGRAGGRAQRGFVACAFALLGVLAGCAAVPVPPPTWLRLPADAGEFAVAPVTAAATPAATPGARDTWQLMLPLPLPAHLERDSLFVPQGAAGTAVQALGGARWVEPLRDAVPRLLREDLVRQLGGPALWVAPLPPGLAPTRQLRIEITTFEIDAEGRALVTQARWSLAEVRGGRPPAVHEARFDTPPAPSVAAPGAEAWALAHRVAVARLAARIAATMAGP